MRNISHEVDGYYVLSEPKGYVVFRPDGVCAVADSTHPKTIDGLSIAITRCNFLARGGARFSCHCCGESFKTIKPQDPARDTGYGTCAGCHKRVARSWEEHGFPGDESLPMAQGLARLRRYA